MQAACFPKPLDLTIPAARPPKPVGCEKLASFMAETSRPSLTPVFDDDDKVAHEGDIVSSTLAFHLTTSSNT